MGTQVKHLLCPGQCSRDPAPLGLCQQYLLAGEMEVWRSGTTLLWAPVGTLEAKPLESWIQNTPFCPRVGGGMYFA